MKKILIIFSAILLFCSCKKLLEEVPKDFISKANYYKDASDAQGAITGAYSSFANNYGIDYWLFLVLHTDYDDGRGSQAPISFFDKLLDQSNIDRAGRIWSSFYTTINRANSVIDNVPDIDMDDNAKTTILAEAHFLRAMSYFNLVRGFGEVPIKTKESVDINSIASPRKPVDSVYQLIISDAMIAEQGLPVSVGNSTGKASVWAAKMLLAKVYLTIEKWDDAAREANDVIENGPYSLVRVQQPNDFYKIFATDYSAEDILSIHFSPTSPSSVPTYIHRANTPPYNYGSSGYYAWLPRVNSFIGDSWNRNDLRKSFNLYTKYIGPNGDSVSLPSSSPILFGKFISDPQGLNIYSLPVYRFSEALLIYAEAASMQNGGPTPLALERLNMVKRRAYGYDPAMASPIDYQDGMNENTFRDTVLQERAYEFLLEGKRWWDLKRTGTVKEALTAVGKSFNDTRLLWPIAENEINNNPEIGQANQNPGY
jgi:hypothetical protein